MNGQPSPVSLVAQGSFPSYQPARVASILKTFLDDVEFAPTGINPVNQALEDYMENLMHMRGIECEQLKRTLHPSAALIELACHKCTLEEKKHMSLFSWFTIYIDDQSVKNPIPFREFGSRLLRRQPQLDPVLTVFTEVLENTWDLYDPLAAGSIFYQSLGFVTGCCIEPELETLPLINGVERFPWYVRDLTGVAIAYALLPFTKRNNFNMLHIIQALPDMNFWSAVTNDLLSFHKEESINEKGTYIYTRARNENKSRYDTCAELVSELRKSRLTIHAALAHNPSALEVWKCWERGFVEFHILAQERYNLKYLGIQI